MTLRNEYQLESSTGEKLQIMISVTEDATKRQPYQFKWSINEKAQHEIVKNPAILEELLEESQMLFDELMGQSGVKVAYVPSEYEFSDVDGRYIDVYYPLDLMDSNDEEYITEDEEIGKCLCEIFTETPNMYEVHVSSLYTVNESNQLIPIWRLGGNFFKQTALEFLTSLF